MKKNITALRESMKRLRSENESLKRKNVELQEENDRIHGESDDVSIQPKRGRRGGMSIEALRARIRKLEDENADLLAVSVNVRF